MAETATHDLRIERLDDTLVWRLGDRVIPLIAGAEDEAGDDSGAKNDSGKNDGEGNDGEGGQQDTAQGDDLPPAVRAVLVKERRAAREAERRAKAAESKVADFEAANKSETEKLREAAETAGRERDQARAELLRQRVAKRVGLPDELVDRLRGSSEEELEEDARSLQAALGVRPGTKPSAPPARDGGNPESDDLDAQIAAAQKAGDWPRAIELKSRQSVAAKE